MVRISHIHHIDVFVYVVVCGGLFVVRASVRVFVCLFVCLFVRSFVRSCVCLRVCFGPPSQAQGIAASA